VAVSPLLRVIVPKLVGEAIWKSSAPSLMKVGVLPESWTVAPGAIERARRG
jgi:hypothetical protein